MKTLKAGKAWTADEMLEKIPSLRDANEVAAFGKAGQCGESLSDGLL
jgi:hypothetical protein